MSINHNRRRKNSYRATIALIYLSGVFILGFIVFKLRDIVYRVQVSNYYEIDGKRYSKDGRIIAYDLKTQSWIQHKNKTLDEIIRMQEGKNKGGI